MPMPTKKIFPASSPSASARHECYRRLIQAVKEDLTRYYQEHPERAGDARSADAIETSLQGMEKILAILDEYSIGFSRRKPGKGAAPGEASEAAEGPAKARRRAGRRPGQEPNGEGG